MIFCKIECINNRDGVCSKEDVVIGLAGCFSMTERDDSVYRKVLQNKGHKEQIKKARQELQELIDELTESIVAAHYSPYSGSTCVYDITNEMADVLNMFRPLKVIFGISDEDLQNAMEDKMKRTLARIEGEHGQ